jgi:hypothetical protein
MNHRTYIAFLTKGGDMLDRVCRDVERIGLSSLSQSVGACGISENLLSQQQLPVHKVGKKPISRQLNLLQETLASLP